MFVRVGVCKVTYIDGMRVPGLVCAITVGKTAKLSSAISPHRT